MISRGPHGYGRSHDAAESSKEGEKLWARERVGHVSNHLINLGAIAEERVVPGPVTWLSRRVFLVCIVGGLLGQEAIVRTTVSPHLRQLSGHCDRILRRRPSWCQQLCQDQEAPSAQANGRRTRK